MSSCPSRCYDNGGRIAGSDAQVNNLQAVRQATLQCAPCATGDGLASFAINGRINLPDGISYWSLNSTTNNVVNTTLPYIDAIDSMQGESCWIAPFNGTLSNLIVRVRFLPTIGARVFTIMLARPGLTDSTATTLGVLFPSGATEFVRYDDSSTVDFETGDLLSMRVSGLDEDAASCAFSVLATMTQ